MLTKGNKPCEMCGEMMVDVAMNRLYCNACARTRKNKRSEKYNKMVQAERAKEAKVKKRPQHYKSKYEMKPRAEKTKNAVASVEEINRLAREAGMSYGQYVCKYMR